MLKLQEAVIAYEIIKMILQRMNDFILRIVSLRREAIRQTLLLALDQAGQLSVHHSSLAVEDRLLLIISLPLVLVIVGGIMLRQLLILTK